MVRGNPGGDVVLYEFHGLGDSLVGVGLPGGGALRHGYDAVCQRFNRAGRILETAFEQFDGVFPAMEEVYVDACEVRGYVLAYFVDVVNAYHCHFVRYGDADPVDCAEYGRSEVVCREEESGRLRKVFQPFDELSASVAAFRVLPEIFKARSQSGCARLEKLPALEAPCFLGWVPDEPEACDIPKCLECLDCGIDWLDYVLA